MLGRDNVAHLVHHLPKAVHLMLVPEALQSTYMSAHAGIMPASL